MEITRLLYNIRKINISITQRLGSYVLTFSKKQTCKQIKAVENNQYNVKGGNGHQDTTQHSYLPRN